VSRSAGPDRQLRLKEGILEDVSQEIKRIQVVLIT
jgi:hypothetical protein